jgi:hypothetical protein
MEALHVLAFFENSPIEFNFATFNSDQHKAISTLSAFNLMKDLHYQYKYKKQNRNDFSILLFFKKLEKE